MGIGLGLAFLANVVSASVLVYQYGVSLVCEILYRYPLLLSPTAT